MKTVGGSMKKRLTVAMFGQKRLTREGGVEIVVKELCRDAAVIASFGNVPAIRHLL